MPTFRFMHVLKSFWLVLVLFMVVQASAQEDATSAPSGSAKLFHQSYIDANFGLANVDGEFVFPGVLFLVGKRMFVSYCFFVDGQLGLAFPSIGTANLVQASATPPTDGRWYRLRPWPTHWYLQVGREDRRCGRRRETTWVARRLKRRGKDLSDILCGRTDFSIGASAWLIDRLKVGKTLGDNIMACTTAMLTAVA